jgi:hypothetical protein
VDNAGLELHRDLMGGRGQTGAVDEGSQHQLEVAVSWRTTLGALNQEVPQDPHPTAPAHPLLFEQQPHLPDGRELLAKSGVQHRLGPGMANAGKVDDRPPRGCDLHLTRFTDLREQMTVHTMDDHGRAICQP